MLIHKQSKRGLRTSTLIIGALVAASLSLSACDSTETAQKTTADATPANTTGANTNSAAVTVPVNPTVAVPATAPVTTGIQNLSTEAVLRKGKIAFLRCRSCHTLEEGDVHLTGPNLHGLMGTTIGTKPGYAFSEPLVASTATWDDESLDLWLKAPSDYIPQNRMVFAGLPNAEDRKALIAYLKEATR